MSTHKIWTCDRCGAEFKTSTRLTEGEEAPLLDVQILIGKLNSHVNFTGPHIKVAWCKQCREAFGLVRMKQVDRDNPNIHPPRTLEEMIREIVSEECAEWHPNV